MPASVPPRVFIVDDDIGLLRLVEKSLQREQISVATAASGQAAIDWLLTNTADLMLLDLKLPDRGGRELMGELNARGRAVPFIIITGQGDERVAVEMMKSGALDYLVKDNNFVDVLPTVVKRTLAQLEKDKRLAAAEKRALELQREILEAAEREQRRIGRDLHDGLGQQLTGLELLNHALVGKLKVAAPELVAPALEISTHIRETIRQTRLLSHNLSPIPLQADGLMLALSKLAENTQTVAGIRCQFECAETVHLPDANTASHLYRITQEAINNALKHSAAKKIEIRLSEKNGDCQLTISDNGQGLTAASTQAAGIGLHMMKYRAGLIGAALEIESLPRKGVRVTCMLRKTG